MTSVESGARRGASDVRRAPCGWGGTVLRAALAAHHGVVRGLRRAYRRTWEADRPRRILLTGTFYSENWIMNHLRPLAESAGCESLSIVCTFPIPETAKVRQLAPSARLCRAIGETPARLALFAWTALRERPDVIGGFHLLANGLAAALMAALTGARAYYFCGGGPREVLDGGIHGNPVFARLLGGADERVEAALVRGVGDFDLVVTMGPRAAAFFERRGVRTAFAAIPGGIDAARYPTVDEAAAVKRYDLIAVGRLARVKRFDILLRAIALLAKERASVRAVLVGAGEDEAALKGLARELALDGHVEFAGHQPDVACWLRQARVFVLTSESEGLSLALMEAMLCGLPAVVSDVGELGELVEHGLNGQLVADHETPEAFAAAIAPLLNDEALAARMGAAARQAALRFELHETARRWAGILLSARGCAAASAGERPSP